MTQSGRDRLPAQAWLGLDPRALNDGRAPPCRHKAAPLGSGRHLSSGTLIHANLRRHRRSHRQHAADQAKARVGGDRLHHPRQGRVHESGPVGEGPRGAPDDPGGGGARRAQAGRAGGRGHRRQYRDRACARRQRARLSHPDRHSRYAEPGKEGHAAAVRRRADPGAGGALQRPDELRPLLGPARRGAGRQGAERVLGRHRTAQRSAMRASSAFSSGT